MSEQAKLLERYRKEAALKVIAALPELTDEALLVLSLAKAWMADEHSGDWDLIYAAYCGSTD